MIENVKAVNCLLINIYIIYYLPSLTANTSNEYFEMILKFQWIIFVSSIFVFSAVQSMDSSKCCVGAPSIRLPRLDGNKDSYSIQNSGCACTTVFMNGPERLCTCIWERYCNHWRQIGPELSTNHPFEIALGVAFRRHGKLVKLHLNSTQSNQMNYYSQWLQCGRTKYVLLLYMDFELSLNTYSIY